MTKPNADKQTNQVKAAASENSRSKNEPKEGREELTGKQLEQVQGGDLGQLGDSGGILIFGDDSDFNP